MFRRIHRLFSHVLRYMQSRLNEKQFLIFSSILVGISSGLAAVILKLFAHNINEMVERYSGNYQDFFLFTLFPLVGLTITVLYLRYFIRKEDFSKGSADIVYAIAKKSSILPQSAMYSHVVTSAFTVGFGGSLGLESPMVSAGSAIGSNYGKTYNLSYKDRTMLLACGAAAAIAGAFNSPIAGVLFAIEVLLTDVSVAVFIPLIISAASGALFVKIILGEGVLLSFSDVQPFDYSYTPFYIALGILAGFTSLYYTRMFTKIEHRVSGIKNIYTKVIGGGLVLALLLIVFPPLYGEGYEGIKTLATHGYQHFYQNSILQPLITTEWAGLLFLVGLLLIKVFATAIAIGSGGNGGNFAPSLCLGAYLGYAFSHFVNIIGWAKLPTANFTLVAMAGILSGVFYAPLTAIFLIAEITGGYNLMIPLMIVAAFSNVIMKYFEPLSMENKKLATKMNLSVENRDKYLLSKLNLENMIETDFQAVKPDDKLRALVSAITKSRRNLFPVVNEDQELKGVILLDSVKEMMFNHELYDKIIVKDIMTRPLAVISPDESLNSVLKKFEDTGQWNLPIIESDRYIGFLSKSSILSEYRVELLRST
ncbi:MAG: chloride channel protein [Cyclobacteriaceae bacterium]|nr:chloride channel protein [Cyclobacteriaceae bacterium]MCB0500618.1 chloride channel protein [Cyclobacteriaceae bacterium]MCB9236333.1 chloride channel protein [Flammeovirgaceae bacterium]MCO5272732.1 chloride channel protein [Cyclobacteriaceae bacterium]MCW5902171.1 chloride channel protein [Cyclobacteriaceae bacterium]